MYSSSLLLFSAILSIVSVVVLTRLSPLSQFHSLTEETVGLDPDLPAWGSVEAILCSTIVICLSQCLCTQAQVLSVVHVPRVSCHCPFIVAGSSNDMLSVS